MGAFRTAQLGDQLHTEGAGGLDEALLASDSQVGVVQVIDQSGTLVAQSAGSPPEPVVDRRLSAGSTQSVGRVQIGPDWDLWVTAAGVETPSGPVTVLVGADREPVEDVTMTVATLLAIGGPIVIALVAFGTYRLVGAAFQPLGRIPARGSSIDHSQLAGPITVPAAD